MKYRILSRAKGGVITYYPQYRNIIGFWSNFNISEYDIKYCNICEAYKYLDSIVKEKELNNSYWKKIHQYPAKGNI